jgi:D-threo-aldose 1-dehydrogenase
MNPFARAPLGRTGVEVTRLGLGLAPIAGLYRAVSELTAAATVDAAWQHGIRYYDTAPLYGGGVSERRGGAALARHERDEFVISTKVGRLLRPGVLADPDIWAEPLPETPVFDYSGAGVRTSHAESLDRLGLSRVDILHIHDPDQHYAEAVTEALPELVAMRKEGTIGAVSAGMNQSAMLTEFARTGEFDCFLLAGRYTLLDQSGLADLLPECAARGISVIVGGVYNSGILADPHDRATYDYWPATPQRLAQARAIQAVCARYDVPLRAAALQFPFGHPAVASVVIGMRSPAEVADAVAMASLDIPPHLWRDLVAEGLLDAEVPVP